MTRPLDPQPLSPRHLAQSLGDAWRLDRPLAAGYRLFDVYRHEQREAVLVELVAGIRRLVVEVSPHQTGPAAAHAAGLALRWRPPGPADAGHAVCQGMARALTDRLGPHPRRWRVLPSSLRHLPAALRAELGWVGARLDDDPDHALLRADGRHYARLFGADSAARRVHAVQGDGPGISMYYPAPRRGSLPPSGAIYPAPARVVHRRRMRTYFAHLGCLFDEDGMPRTVPTPHTLTRALAGRPALARLRPRLVRIRGLSLRAAAWARSVAGGVLPVSVAPAWAVELMRVLRRARRLQRISIDVGMLVHDISLHALGLHAIPGAAWDALVTRAAALGPRHAPQVAAFFEETLTRTCWALWRELDAPADFAGAFERRTDDLLAALDAVETADAS